MLSTATLVLLDNQTFQNALPGVWIFSHHQSTSWSSAKHVLRIPRTQFPAIMSIRRKSTTHDLATLRLHPDGSRVQQSSVNSRHRTAASTFVDSRGNWIARDAGGQSSVKKRRSVSVVTDEGESEQIKLSSDEEDGGRAPRKGKGKERTRDDQALDEGSAPEDERLNTRTKRRLSFIRDFSFLDPPPQYPPFTEQDALDSDASSGSGPEVTFQDPDPVSAMYRRHQ